MEVLKSELSFQNITFEKSTTEDALSLALRGLKLNTNKKVIKQDSKPSVEEKNLSSITGLNNIYTLDDVLKHQSPKSCWIILYDRVYDVTKFLDLHPGGLDILFENAGRDATFAFHGIHSNIALHMLKDYLIGELPETEKLYRKKSGHSISLTDMPE